MSWLHRTDSIELITECIETLGTRDLFQPFFSLIDAILGVDQCMVFMLDTRSYMSCLLSRNFQEENIAAPLAKAYIESGYKSDPNLEILSGLTVGETRTVHLEQLFDLMSAEYRDQFFSHPGLADKVSIMSFNGRHHFYVNLYRTEGKRTFSEDGLFNNPAEPHLISSLLVRHYTLNESLRAEGPLAFLSDRERQVCRGILAGKKMEAIAADIGVAASTVITYRKRAYEKLGITSRGALFALCRD
ncbi:MAG: LuxR C-terminal-related transcriptional regulator [Calditrichaeota bacterium]|nr:LuxR C-terminal-related transcriptional regulator [Calditrichota bacterium]